ncbi:MAG: hypothetical protein JXA33_09715 [Anaerolineae bacterium]|nr:hypothetical protein [Anaerolineae bacterium]
MTKTQHPNKKPSPIRIRGLVKFMNHVRDQISAGITASEMDDFRVLIRDMISQVERICRQYHCQPEQLPAPSYRAYQYLKSLNLNKLPIRTMTTPPPKTLRITNIVMTSNHFHSQFQHLVNNKNTEWTPQHPDIKRLSCELRSHADGIAGLVQEERAVPADLPTRSQHAYQWLAFLSEAENLSLHLNTLTVLTQFSKNPICRQMLSSSECTLPIHIELYVSSSLYRTRARSNHIHITFNEGYVGAPEDTLQALICLALRSQDPTQLSKIKTYAISEEFTEILSALESITAQVSQDTQGRVYNLTEIFERVNVNYFNNTLPRPHLMWNQTVTHRKMGHYQPLTDTVMISITLDDVRVPSYVIDAVMYHELLHKHLGIQVINGRRYAHTSEFRAEELKFRQYEEAQKFLSQLHKKLRL